MSVISEFPNKPLPEPQDVLVWDLPVRIGHWLMVTSVAGAWLTSESERLAALHMAFGYVLAAIIVFRLLWGFFGTRYARWVNFLPNGKRLSRYLASIARGRPEHYVGHNPLGALGVFGMLGMLAGSVVSGILASQDLGWHWIEEMHEVFAQGLLILATLHLIGVAVSSRLHKENLVKSMVTGLKTERIAGIRSAQIWVGLILLASCIYIFIASLRA